MTVKQWWFEPDLTAVAMKRRLEELPPTHVAIYGGRERASDHALAHRQAEVCL